MEINTVLMLLTLALVTNQAPTKTLNGWKTFEIYQDNCPLNKELWNPYQKDAHLKPDTICLCEGNYKEEHRKRYNHGPYRECPKLEQHGLTSAQTDTFLLCWSQQTQFPENRYRLMVPTEYLEHVNIENHVLGFPRYSSTPNMIKIAPLFYTKYPHALKKLETDRRCNFQLSEQLRNKKLSLRDVCSYRGLKHKKGFR